MQLKVCGRAKHESAERLVHSCTMHGKYRVIRRLKHYCEYFRVGEVCDSFLCDKGHANGKEVHHVTDNGVIFIVNAHTGLLVTVLFARPGQIKRYYVQLGEDAPQSLVDIAKAHEAMGANAW